MKQITTWRPDTCGCEIEIEWDDTVPQETRTHSQGKIISKCKAHMGVTDKDVLKELFDENQTKNRTISKIAEVMGYTHKDIMDGKIEYNFDGQRKLSFMVDSMDTVKKDAINAAIEADPEIDTVKATRRIKSIVAK